MRRLLLRLYHRASVYYCVVMMLHDAVDDYITNHDLVPVPAEFFKDSERTWLP